MKVLILLSALLFLSNCAIPAAAPSDKSVAADKSSFITPTPENTNSVIVGNFTPLSPEESIKIDNTERRKAESQIEKLKDVPEQLKKVDFLNFKYPRNQSATIIALKDGGYQYEYKSNGCVACGGENYNLKSIYYTNLTGDDKKEAIVHMTVVSCGGSCDGGSDLFYFYSIRQNKLKLLWQYETGSLAYGCGLKSFAVKNGKITIEQFGKCVRNKNLNDSTGMNKFQIQDTTRFVFGFDERKFVQDSKGIIPVTARSIMNHTSEISIDE